MIIPMIIISSMIIKNLKIFDIYNYGTPFEILNQNLAFLRFQNDYEDSQIQQIIFKEKKEKESFLKKFKHLDNLRSFENNQNKENYLKQNDIQINYPIDSSVIIKKEKCFKKNSYLKNLQLNDDILWKTYLHTQGKIEFTNKDEKLLKDKIYENNLEVRNDYVCSQNMNWYGNKMINDLRKSEIKNIFLDYPLIPIFIFQQNFLDSLNSSMDYFMIFPNRMRSLRISNFLEKLYYPSLKNLFGYSSNNYFLDKFSKVSISKIILLIIFVYFLIKNIRFLLAKPNFINIMAYTIFFSLLTIFFGSGEYERYFFMNEPLIFLMVLFFIKLKKTNLII